MPAKVNVKCVGLKKSPQKQCTTYRKASDYRTIERGFAKRLFIPEARIGDWICNACYLSAYKVRIIHSLLDTTSIARRCL